MTLRLLTDEQRMLVAESFARLVPISADAADVFYNYLWTYAPQTRMMFASTDMGAQGTKLMQTLGMTVRALYDVESIRPFLRELGQRHIGYGVTADQYALLKAALLHMLAHCLGDQYTTEVQGAWSAAYDLIASLAVSAYE